MAGMLIAGERTDGAAGEGIDVVDPATEETLETVPRGTAADVDAAVNAADAAFGAWSKTDAEDRAILLRKAIALIERDRKELTMSLVHEQGKPVTEAGGEIHHLIHGLNYYADLATKVRGSHQRAAVGAEQGLRHGPAPPDGRRRRDRARTTSRSRCSARSSRRR